MRGRIPRRRGRRWPTRGEAIAFAVTMVVVGAGLAVLGTVMPEAATLQQASNEIIGPPISGVITLAALGLTLVIVWTIIQAIQL